MRDFRFVSCVCPTYARPRFLEQAVKLFLRQTWTKSELIILDDSPKSERAEIKDTPRVKVVRISERIPMGEKHNWGLDLAQGDFIAHFDDDDWQSPRRLVRQLEALELQGFDLCGFQTDCLLTTGDARFWRFDRSFGKRAGFIGNSVIDYGVPFMDGSAMFRRSAARSFRYPTIATGQKVAFLHQIWKAGGKLKSLPNDGTYIYVRHKKGGSAMNTWQYWSDRRLLSIPRPPWFPDSELDFYRRVA